MVSSEADVVHDDRLESTSFSSDSSVGADPDDGRRDVSRDDAKAVGDDVGHTEDQLLGVDPFSHKIEMPTWMW